MKNSLFLILFLSTFFITNEIFALDKVEINTASLQQLDTLADIGPVKAQAIIDGRPYSSVNDLDRVKGIGPATLQKIKDQGLAYVGGQTTQTVVQAPTPPPTPTPSPEPAIIYPSGIFINEVLPNPEGSDETDEWIELYNSNNFDVDLSKWQIQDIIGTTATYLISQNTNIGAQGFIIFRRPATKIMLNNDEDGINLLTPDKKIVYSTAFTGAPLGQSYNRYSGGWAWSTTLTPVSVNKITTPVAKNVANKTSLSLSKTQKSDNNGNIKAEDLIAGLSQPLSPGTNPWPMFLIVLASTIVLAVIVLLIKFKLKKYVRT